MQAASSPQSQLESRAVRGARLEAPAPLPDLDEQQHARAARVAHVHHAVQVRVLARGALAASR
jgi:hypothetical protein